MLSRTYAQFVAGATKLMKYNPDSKEFTLVYSTTSACASNITEGYEIILRVTYGIRQERIMREKGLCAPAFVDFGDSNHS